MKKSLVALAALAAVGAASAQSSVTLYGVVDANITAGKASGASSLISMGSGGLNGSRWGLRGTEDLGGGLSGIFRLEGGFDTSDGTMGQTATVTTARAVGTTPAVTTSTNRIFGRHATVGLQGGFGSVRLGRTLTPIGVLSDESATLGTKGADLMATAGMLGATTYYRTDNAITFDSANMGGLTFSAQYSLGQNLAERSDRGGRQYGFNVIYKGGPLQAGLGYLNIDSLVTAPVGATGLVRGPDQKAIQGNLGFNFGFASVKAVVERDDIGTVEDPTFIGLEASVPLGAFTASLGVARLKDSTGAAGVSDNANLYTLQGVYNMSKRTALYTFYTHADNDGVARRSAGGVTPVAGGNARALQVGVRHSF